MNKWEYNVTIALNNLSDNIYSALILENLVVCLFACLMSTYKRENLAQYHNIALGGPSFINQRENMSVFGWSVVRIGQYWPAGQWGPVTECNPGLWERGHEWTAVNIGQRP